MGSERGFSWDHNRLLPNFPDYELLPTHVWRFEELHQRIAPHLDYNTFKVLLYCRASCYIGVQGGSSHLTASFGGRQLILHVMGSEWRSGAYEGWYHQVSPSPLELIVVRKPSQLVAAAKSIFAQPPRNKSYTTLINGNSYTVT